MRDARLMQSRTNGRDAARCIVLAVAVGAPCLYANAQQVREEPARRHDPTQTANQPAPPAAPADRWRAPTYIPVDAGVADLNELGVSLRLIEAGLQLPTGFSNVYEVPNTELLMRVHGALHAVFPNSRYIPTDAGNFPQVPNDTTFFIGAPQFEDMSRYEHGRDRSALLQPNLFTEPEFRSRRVDHRVETASGSAIGLSLRLDLTAGGLPDAPTRGMSNTPQLQDLQLLASHPELQAALAAGELPPSLLGEHADAAADRSELIALLHDPSALDAAGPADSPSEQPTIANDAEYRARRMRELMRIAVGDNADLPD